MTYPLISEVQEAVCQHYKLVPLDMTANRRHTRVSRPRQVAMYLVRHMTPRSYPEIGRKFGDRDHSTIIHGVRMIEKLLLLDLELVEDVRAIRSELDSLVIAKRRKLAFGDDVSGD